MPTRESSPLPLPHRLALLYLAVPFAIWLVGWFEWWVGVPLAALLAFAIAPALRGGWRVRFTRTGVGLALAMLALVLVLPAGGLFAPETQDWVHNRGTLLDLGRGDWPTYVTVFGDDGPKPLLRYHLGYLIVPGLLGKWLGPWALNWLVPLWTWFGLVLLALMFARRLPTLRAALLAVAIGLVLFSGMDLLGYMLREGMLDGAQRFWERVRGRQSPLFLTTPDSPMVLDYLPFALQLRNSVGHFLAAGLGAMLLFQLRGERRLHAMVGVLLVLAAFTSAPATLGLVPLAACLLWRCRLRGFLTWPNLLAAPVLAALLALYFASGELQSRGWLLPLYPSGTRALRDVLVLYLTEFALLALLVWRLRPSVAHDPFFVAALLVLLVVPWYWYGDPDFSESIMRAPLPSLFVLGYYAARVVVDRLPEGAALQRCVAGATTAPPRLGIEFVLLLCALGVGALSASAEYANVLRRPGWLPYQASHLTTVFVSAKDVAQRTARDLPPLLVALLREHENKGGPKGMLVLRSDYHVYQRGSIFVFVRKACDVDFESTTRFLVRGVGRAAAGGTGELAPFVRNFGMRPGALRRAGACLAWLRLPTAAIARLRLAQTVPGEGVVWEADVVFDAAGRASARSVRRREEFFAARYRALLDARVGAPAVSSRFDVYMAGDDLVFTKAPCSAADTAAKFFAHVFPEQSEVLPSHRRGQGFDNLDFHFGRRGARVESGCATAVALPRYPIRRVRVGQWREADGRVLWQADIAADRAAG